MNDTITVVLDEKLAALEKLVSDLDRFKSALEKLDYIREKPLFFEMMTNIWRYFSEFEDDEVYEIFEKSEDFGQYRNFFAQKGQYYFRAWEIYQAILTLTNNSPFLTSPSRDMKFLGFTKSGYISNSSEMEMVDLENVNSVLVVGCGSMPHTLLFINENTSIKNIVGIDGSAESIYMAGEIIRAVDAPRIKLEHSDGVKFDYSDIDLILLSAYATPQRKILDRIIETSKDSVQIIVRSATRLGKMFNESAENNLSEKLVVVSEIRRNAGSKSILVKKI